MATDNNIKSTRKNVQREKEVRRDNDKIQELKIGLYEIDEAIKFYFDKVAKLQVTDSSGLVAKVPVIYASPENWKSFQASEVKRDNRGKLQLPIIAYKRDSITKDRNLGNKVDVNEPLYTLVPQGYNDKTKYDRTTILNKMLEGHKKSKIYKKIVVPDFLTVTYSIIIYTEFLTQMNGLIEAISYNEGSYWGDKSKYLVRAKIDDFPSVVESEIGEDRIVKSEFQLTINGHIIPKNIQQAASLGSVKALTKTQIVMGETTVSDINNVAKRPTKPSVSTTSGGPVTGGVKPI